MSFPAIRSSAVSSEATDQTSHTVNLPATVELNDLLLVFFACDGNTAVSWPGSWVELFEKQNTVSGTPTLSVGYLQADGTEDGTTITVTTAASERSAHRSHAISGAELVANQAPEAGTAESGSSANPTHPSAAATGGAKDILWWAVYGCDDGTTTLTGTPSNYGNAENIQSDGATGCCVGSTRRELNASSEDPGNSTLSGSVPWAGNTIVIHPHSSFLLLQEQGRV